MNNTRWKRNEVLRDIRDGEAGKHKDGLYEYVLSIPALLFIAAVIIYCFVKGLT